MLISTVMVCIAAVAGAGAASAVDVSSGVTNVVITTDGSTTGTVMENDRLLVSGDWPALEQARGGDTFRVTLPPELAFHQALDFLTAAQSRISELASTGTELVPAVVLALVAVVAGVVAVSIHRTGARRKRPHGPAHRSTEKRTGPPRRRDGLRRH